MCQQFSDKVETAIREAISELRWEGHNIDVLDEVFRSLEIILREALTRVSNNSLESASLRVRPYYPDQIRLVGDFYCRARGGPSSTDSNFLI